MSSGRWMWMVAVVVAGGCKDGGEQRLAPKVADGEPLPATQPERTAAGDRDVRVLLAELTAARACEGARGQMIGVPAQGSNVVMGTLWIERCQAKNRGLDVTIELSGSGWQWAAEKKKQAGAEFALRQYTPFRWQTSITGKVDLGYHPGKKVLSLWYTPERAPPVKFEPVGDIEVDEEGAWSSVIGALATVFVGSPEAQAEGEIDKQGTRSLRRMLAEGFAITIDACTGRAAFDLGRPALGQMIPKRRVADSPRRARVEPGGLLMLGPHRAGKRLSVDVRIDGPGVVDVDLVCQPQAAAMATAFVANQSVTAPEKPLLTRTVTGREKIEVKSPDCPVVVAIRGLGVPADVTFVWERIPADQGKPLLHCEK